MKSMKSLLGIGLASVIVLTGMFSVSAAADTKYNTQTVTMAQAAGMYKTQGRTGLVGTGLSMDWSGSGIEFNADCEGSIVLDLRVQSYEEHAFFTVYVDGVRMNRLEAKTSSADREDVKLVIASNLTQGKHSICFYNQTECIAALVSIESIEISGQLTDPPKNNDMLIEYVGDSYFTGYGCMVSNDDTKVDLNDTPYISDGTQSIGVLTSANLHADYSVVSVSGYGLTCGTSGKDSNVPKYYDYVSWQRSHTDSSADAWDFSRHPDVVVVELGDNDGYFASSSGVTYADFQTAAKDFVQHIRSKNPNAKIVWIMYGSFNKQITSAMNELGGTDAGLYTTTLALGNGGAFGHPNVDQLHTAADTFTAYLKNTVLSSTPATSTTTATTTTNTPTATTATTTTSTTATTTTTSSSASTTSASTNSTGASSTSSSTTVITAGSSISNSSESVPDTETTSSPVEVNTGDASRNVIPWLIGFDVFAVALAFILYKKKAISDIEQ